MRLCVFFFQLVFLEFFEALLSFAAITVTNQITKSHGSFQNYDFSKNKLGTTYMTANKVTINILEVRARDGFILEWLNHPQIYLGIL